MKFKDHFNRTLFWDVNFDELNVGRSPAFVVQRVVDRGTDLQKDLLIKYYGFDFVRKTMLNARYKMPFGIHFVLVRLDIPLTELRFYKECKL